MKDKRKWPKKALSSDIQELDLWHEVELKYDEDFWRTTSGTLDQEEKREMINKARRHYTADNGGSS